MKFCNHTIILAAVVAGAVATSCSTFQKVGDFTSNAAHKVGDFAANTWDKIDAAGRPDSLPSPNAMPRQKNTAVKQSAATSPVMEPRASKPVLADNAFETPEAPAATLQPAKEESTKQVAKEPAVELDGLPKIYLAGGDYFSVRDNYRRIEGVKRVEPCYINSYNPSTPILAADPVQRHEAVAYGNAPAGAAEAFAIAFDPEVVSVEFLVEMYLMQVDATAFNITSGPDALHRKGIYYHDKSLGREITQTTTRIADNYRSDLQIEILPLQNLTPITH